MAAKQLGSIGLVQQAAAGKVVALRPSDAGTAVAVIGALPPPPPVLARALDAFVNPHADNLPDRSLVTQAAQAAAAVRLGMVQAQARNATLEEWDAFLFPLCNPLVMANPIDAKALTAALPFIVPMIGYMPVACLTPENRLALVARRFFPKPADLVEVMAEDKRRLTVELTALRRLLAVELKPAAPVGVQRAENALVAWMEAAAGKPDDVRGLQVRGCIRRLGNVAPALLARYRDRLEAMLPQAQDVPQAPQEPPQAAPARQGGPLPPAATAEAQAARLWLARLAEGRARGLTFAQIQAEAARQVDTRDT